MAFPQIFQVDFGVDEMEILHKYISNNVIYIKEQNRSLREEILPRWIRIYRGTPAEAEATFPWQGAANLIIQIAGTHCDELLARVMAIWSTSPIFIAETYGDYGDGKSEDERAMIETFMDKMAFESRDLDLYRVEETVFSSTIRYGTGIIKVPYEYLVEKQPVFLPGLGADTGSDGSIAKSSAIQLKGYTEDGETARRFRDVVRRDGPHPEAVPLNLWGMDPRYPNLNNAPFYYHILQKNKTQLEEMTMHPEIFNEEKIQAITGQPDRDGPDEFRRQLQEDKQQNNAVGEGSVGAEWDIYECWFRYRKGEYNYSLVSYYHQKTDTILGTIYNMYPENQSPFEDAKLAYDDDTYFGYGLCEMLSAYQEEVSKTHNWRRNNRDFATTGIGRVNKNSKLSSLVQLFPGLLIPADQGEIEPLQFGAGALQYGTEDEMLTLSLAKERSGIDPAIGGAGGGIINPKRGIYSAQGTAAVMQQQNNRNNLRMCDMRSLHVRTGRKILDIYSHFGIGNKKHMFGDKNALLKEALESYKEKKLGLGIKAATASLNKELEKQNDILLSATLERLYAGDAQILQSLATPNIPPDLKDYYTKVLKAKNALMKHILRNFGRDDTDRLVPVPSIIKERQNGTSGANGAGPAGNAGNLSQALQQASGNQGAIPIGGGQTPGGIPQGPANQQP